jgi:hypothetical protein
VTQLPHKSLLGKFLARRGVSPYNRTRTVPASFINSLAFDRPALLIALVMRPAPPERRPEASGGNELRTLRQVRQCADAVVTAIDIQGDSGGWHIPQANLPVAAGSGQLPA